MSIATADRAAAALAGKLEMWGGVEYTCNRVGETYFDQMELSGHATRPQDYDKIAALGIRTLRMGVLWERHEQDPSWRCEDSHLGRLRELGVRPIAGLLHHGSGPRHTSLLDPEFPEKLAAYAREVAERYPWIDMWTPVNEPNTTARFSGHYGVWFPHHRSRESYLRALVNELKATSLAMQAVRCVRPDAQLVQTDDIGHTTGTAAMRPMCDLLNERRWLPYDLLCGRVDREHTMFAYMRDAGISEWEIFWFAENPCLPDVIGVNYYVTSDRYLDHRMERYAGSQISSEGPFADVETVRYHEDAIVGVGTLLRQVWERYDIPVAITEVHLGSTVDEQIRWMVESWNAAQSACADGVKCVAVTPWALLGSFYWNELVTHVNGHYEPGLFDVRGGEPQATELAAVVAELAAGRRPRHAALGQAGWWRRPERLLVPVERKPEMRPEWARHVPRPEGGGGFQPQM